MAINLLQNRLQKIENEIQKILDQLKIAQDSKSSTQENKKHLETQLSEQKQKKDEHDAALKMLTEQSAKIQQQKDNLAAEKSAISADEALVNCGPSPSPICIQGNAVKAQNNQKRQEKRAKSDNDIASKLKEYQDAQAKIAENKILSDKQEALLREINEKLAVFNSIDQEILSYEATLDTLTSKRLEIKLAMSDDISPDPLAGGNQPQHHGYEL